MKKVGQGIGRYRITDQLGTGGMAIIYKAYDTRLERDVAIKVIRTKAIPAQQHERLMRRFQREAKAQAKFNHPNIVPVYDYGVHEGMPYLVMEYIPGGTLKERITGPVDVQQAVAWVLPIADALAYAHEQGIVHRDVKPSNVLITQDNKPLLTDFGIAKVLEANEGTLTATGMGVGTPEYMAPEQWQWQTSEGTDQYALGVVLYELLTGHKPFTAETAVAIALKQMKDPLKPPSELVSGIPEVVEKVVYKVLARDPKERYLDLTTFQRALADAAGKSVEVLRANHRSAVEKPEKTKKGKKRIGWLWAVASLTVVVVIALLGFRGDWDNLLSRFSGGQGGETNDVSSVAKAAATPAPFLSPTSTMEPSPTITEKSTLSPTTEPVYSFNYINADYQLMRYDLSSGNTTKVIDLIPSKKKNTENIWEKFIAAWSKNDQYLAYSPVVPESRNNVYEGIYIYDLENQEQIIIADGLDKYRLLGFSPDNTKFVYSSNEKGVPGLFVYDIENRSSLLIALHDRIFITATWNKDSTGLYFASDEALYKYNFLTYEKETIIESSLGLVIEIILSPDDSQLYLYCTEEVTQWLSIVDLTNYELHRITSTEPRWDYSFWKWYPEDSIITGSWISNGGEQGKFIINAEDYNIEFEKDENEYGLYYDSLILENEEFSVFWFIKLYSTEFTYCLDFFTNPEFTFLTQICANDFSNISVSENQRYLFIQRSTNQVHQIDLSNDLATTITTFDDGVLWFQLVEK